MLIWPSENEFGAAELDTLYKTRSFRPNYELRVKDGEFHAQIYIFHTI